MSAIEVLKREKKYMKLHCGAISNGQWIPRDLRLAFDEALLALEQKEKFVKILRDINYLMEGKDLLKIKEGVLK